MGIVIRIAPYGTEKKVMGADMRVRGVSRRAKRTEVPMKPKATGSPKKMAPKQQANINTVISSTLNLSYPRNTKIHKYRRLLKAN